MHLKSPKTIETQDTTIIPVKSIISFPKHLILVSEPNSMTEPNLNEQN